MISPARAVAFGLATMLMAQPCLAADQSARSVRAAGATAVVAASFDLSHDVAATSSSKSMSLHASRQSAAEAEQQQKRKGSGGKTWLIVGGVVLLVVVIAAAVAGAMPTAGPPEGAFD